MKLSELITRLQSRLDGVEGDVICAGQIWFPEDVHQCCEDRELGELSPEEADEVLRRMEEFHDCNYGDDWDSMTGYIRDVREERKC